MASQPCWRCLSRQTLTPRTLFSATPPAATQASAPFSSTSLLSKTPLAPQGNKSARPGAQSRGRKALKLSKRQVVRTGKPPAVGERKAIRKRIVLSNTNALEVDSLRDLSGRNYADAELLGAMVALPGWIVDALRACETFRPAQAWGFFRRPATLVRGGTMEIARHVRACGGSEGERSTLRRIILGEKGAGKSVLLLQAQAVAFQAGWVVIHIPDARDITSATTSYAPIPDTKPTKYMQPEYTAAFLSRIAKANEAVLSSLTLTKEHTLPVQIQPKTTLHRLVEIGAEDPSIAWPVYTALWSELTNTDAPADQRRPPILLSLEGLADVSRLSHYLAPNMYNIHAYDLALADNFMSHLTGEVDLPNGGMVLAADSTSNRPSAPSLDVAMRQTEAEGAAAAAKLPLYDALNPYDKHDPRVLQRMRGVPLMRVTGLSKAEAKTLLEYYAKSGVLQGTVTDAMVTEKFALAGQGVVGELERDALRSM